MEGFVSKVPEPEVEEKRGLTAEELEAVTAEMYKIQRGHFHEPAKSNKIKSPKAESKARAKRKMADKSRRRNRK